MQYTDVRAVIAIGLSGQFGLRGRLPWEGNRGREYVADVEYLSWGDAPSVRCPNLLSRTVTSSRFILPKGRLTCSRDFAAVSCSSAAGRPSTRLMRLSSAIGTSTGCPMMARPTAGSILPGWSTAVIGAPLLDSPRAGNGCQ